MSEVAAWRSFLKDIFRRLDADQKVVFAKEVGVSQATINRWRRGKDRPNPSNLERLLTVVTDEERGQLLVLMRKDPKMIGLLPASVHVSNGDELLEGASASLLKNIDLDHFCLTLLRLQRDSPDRFWQLSGAILRECLMRLETHPLQVGIEVSVVTCMPPRDGKVRSLRALVGMGTPPWRGDIHEKEYFLGLESLAGYVVTTRRGEMISDLTLHPLHAPAPYIEHERSAAAFPIMHTSGDSSSAEIEMTVAGALVASCTQPNYFIPERMDILEVFADIIRLALHEYTFYPSSQIALVTLPSWSVQQGYLQSFWERVAAENKRAGSGDKRSFKEVEEEVRKLIEGELLQEADSPSINAVKESSSMVL